MGVTPGDEFTSSAEADAEQMLRRARKAGLFASLARIYSEFPATECENCARCCFESPGIFYIEYLHLLEVLAAMPEQRRAELIARAFRELMFSWIEPERTCIFLESGRCTIYERRPLACRLFGLVPAADRDRAEAEARMAAREEARRLSRFGIEVPEAVIQRSLTSCEKVRDRQGNQPVIDGEAVAAKVARLDAALIPQQVVMQEFCFRALPERIGAASFDEESVELLRVQLLRRAQAGQPIGELVKLVLAQARLPRALRTQRPKRPAPKR